MRNQVFRILDKINFRTTRRDLIMAFDSKDGVMFELNDTASDVFRLIDGTRSVGDIATAICEEYEAEPEGVIEDIEVVLERFKNVGLVEEVTNAASDVRKAG